jgi:hypothetical protein
VQEDDRLALRIAALLEVELVVSSDRETPRAIWLDFWIEDTVLRGHAGDLARQ